MFKKKFDYNNGEIRECKTCKEEFHTMKPKWLCKKCHSTYIYEMAKKNAKEGMLPTGPHRGLPPKKNYPFSNISTASLNRFCNIRQKLRKAWEEGPEAVKEHYDRQFKEIEENGIMEWIFDRRDDESMKEKSGGKTKKKTNIEFPDTRGYHEY